MQQDDTTRQSRDTLAPSGQPRFIEVRGPSGRLYGRLDPQTLVMEFRRGKVVERIDLTLYRTRY